MKSISPDLRNTVQRLSSPQEHPIPEACDEPGSAEDRFSMTAPDEIYTFGTPAGSVQSTDPPAPRETKHATASSFAASAATGPIGTALAQKLYLFLSSGRTTCQERIDQYRDTFSAIGASSDSSPARKEMAAYGLKVLSDTEDPDAADLMGKAVLRELYRGRNSSTFYDLSKDILSVGNEFSHPRPHVYRPCFEALSQYPGMPDRVRQNMQFALKTGQEDREHPVFIELNRIVAESLGDPDQDLRIEELAYGTLNRMERCDKELLPDLYRKGLEVIRDYPRSSHKQKDMARYGLMILEHYRGDIPYYCPLRQILQAMGGGEVRTADTARECCSRMTFSTACDTIGDTMANGFLAIRHNPDSTDSERQYGAWGLALSEEASKNPHFVDYEALIMKSLAAKNSGSITEKLAAKALENAGHPENREDTAAYFAAAFRTIEISPFVTEEIRQKASEGLGLCQNDAADPSFADRACRTLIYIRKLDQIGDEVRRSTAEMASHLEKPEDSGVVTIQGDTLNIDGLKIKRRKSG